MHLKSNYSMQKEQRNQVRQSTDTIEYNHKTLDQDHSNNIYWVILTALVESGAVRS